jgi:hypothetical protein
MVPAHAARLARLDSVTAHTHTHTLCVPITAAGAATEVQFEAGFSRCDTAAAATAAVVAVGHPLQGERQTAAAAATLCQWPQPVHLSAQHRRCPAGLEEPGLRLFKPHL